MWSTRKEISDLMSKVLYCEKAQEKFKIIHLPGTNETAILTGSWAYGNKDWYDGFHYGYYRGEGANATVYDNDGNYLREQLLPEWLPPAHEIKRVELETENESIKQMEAWK